MWEGGTDLWAKERRYGTSIGNLGCATPVTRKQGPLRGKEYNFEVCFMFIDFMKVFDMIYHNKVWGALTKDGIPKEIVKILANQYKNSKAYIKLDTKGEEFHIGRGVKQGDPLSLNIFNSFWNKYLEKSNGKERV